MLNRIERHPARQQIRAEIPDEAWRTVKEALIVEWVSLTHHMAFNEALRRVLGDEGIVDFWEGIFLDLRNAPVLRVLIDGALHITGIDPVAILRRAGGIYARTNRGCGVLTIRLSDKEPSCLALLDQFPLAHFRSETYSIAFAGVLRGVLTAGGKRGKVDRVEVELAAGRTLYRLEW